MSVADYAMNPAHAAELAGAALLPREFRVMAAKLVLKDHGADPAELIADIIGMANSVVANCTELLKTEAVARGWVHFNEVERINFPSMNGALMGVSLAAGVDPRKVCHGCAFRLGSVANQCAPTQYDASDAVAGEYIFNCHEDLDAKGKPTQACRGFAQARKLVSP
jgi:hypothetical protein